MQPGDGPSRPSDNSSSVFDLPDIALSEVDFLEYLFRRARELDALEPIFPGMVFYNVPAYLMKNLWPEKLEQWKKDPELMGFAANESGWKGKLDNLQSRFNTFNRKVTLHKNFVMHGRYSIALCAAIDEQELNTSEVALCWISLQDPEIELIKRDDPASTFAYANQTFSHYRMEGQINLKKDDFKLIPASSYRRFGPVFMMREVTGLGAIALGLLAANGIQLEARQYIQQAGTNRQNGRPRKEDLLLARQYISRLCQEVSSRHALWDRMNSLP